MITASISRHPVYRFPCLLRINQRWRLANETGRNTRSKHHICCTRNHSCNSHGLGILCREGAGEVFDTWICQGLSETRLPQNPLVYNLLVLSREWGNDPQSLVESSHSPIAIHFLLSTSKIIMFPIIMTICFFFPVSHTSKRVPTSPVTKRSSQMAVAGDQSIRSSPWHFDRFWPILSCLGWKNPAEQSEMLPAQFIHSIHKSWVYIFSRIPDVKPPNGLWAQRQKCAKSFSSPQDTQHLRPSSGFLPQLWQTKLDLSRGFLASPRVSMTYGK